MEAVARYMVCKFENVIIYFFIFRLLTDPVFNIIVIKYVFYINTYDRIINTISFKLYGIF